MNNYPMGTRNHDSDPRSPFYEGPPECEECGNVLSLDSDCDEDGVFVTTYCKECDG